jgi:hypothetical protein
MEQNMGRRPYAETMTLSDDAIGVVSMSAKNSTHILIYFDKKCTDALGCDRVCFNKKELTVRMATIDDRGIKLSGRDNASLIGIDVDDAHSMAGLYEMVDEGKYFKLYRFE